MERRWKNKRFKSAKSFLFALSPSRSRLSFSLFYDYHFFLFFKKNHSHIFTFRFFLCSPRARVRFFSHLILAFSASLLFARSSILIIMFASFCFGISFRWLRVFYLSLCRSVQFAREKWSTSAERRANTSTRISAGTDGSRHLSLRHRIVRTNLFPFFPLASSISIDDNRSRIRSNIPFVKRYLALALPFGLRLMHSHSQPEARRKKSRRMRKRGTPLAHIHNYAGATIRMSRTLQLLILTRYALTSR